MPSHNNLISTLKEYGNISDEEKKLIRKHFRFASLKKNEIFKSKHSNNIIFVNTGLLRAFVEDKKGFVCTRIIAWENRFLTNINVFKHFNSSDETIEALENSEILYIEKDFFYQLLSHCPNLNIIYLNILSEYNELYIRKYSLYACKSIEEKMLFLKDNFPHLIKRTNDNILASFLGISRESYVRGKIYL